MSYLIVPPLLMNYAGATGVNSAQTYRNNEIQVPSTAQAQALTRQNVLNVRNSFRYGYGGYSVNFNKPLPSPRYVVSDIGRFSGTGNAETEYYFVIEDTDLECQWLLVFPGPGSVNNIVGAGSGWGGAVANAANLVQMAQAAPMTTLPTTWVHTATMGFAPDTDDWDFNTVMGFNNTTTLSYSGGDFTTVATPPSSQSALQDWHYNAEFKSMSFGDGFASNTTSSGTPIGFVMDGDTGTLMAIAGEVQNHSMFVNRVANLCLFSKSLFVSNEIGDDYLYGGLWGGISHGALGTPVGVYGGFNGELQSSIANIRVGAHGYSADGDYIPYYGLGFFENFNKANWLDNTGKLKWRYVSANSGTDDKGLLNPKVCLATGSRHFINSKGLSFDNDGVNMMNFGNLAFPYPAGVPEPFFSFPEWGAFFDTQIVAP